MLTLAVKSLPLAHLCSPCEPPSQGRTRCRLSSGSRPAPHNRERLPLPPRGARWAWRGGGQPLPPRQAPCFSRVADEQKRDLGPDSHPNPVPTEAFWVQGSGA